MNTADKAVLNARVTQLFDEYMTGSPLVEDHCRVEIRRAFRQGYGLGLIDGMEAGSDIVAQAMLDAPAK